MSNPRPTHPPTSPASELPPKPLSRLARGLAVGLLGAVLWGYAPTLEAASPRGEVRLTTATALAQTPTEVSEEEVLSYARSVLEMDGPRLEAYTNIKNLLIDVDYDINQVDLACPNTRSLNQLPRSVRNRVRDIVVAYCSQASTIVEGNGLSNDRFNQISEAHRQDDALKRRIYDTLLDLQQVTP